MNRSISISCLAGLLLLGQTIPAARADAETAPRPTMTHRPGTRTPWWSKFWQKEVEKNKEAAPAESVARGRRLFSFLRPGEEKPSDPLLVSRCRGLLRGDSQLAASPIRVFADEGVIVLRGHVDSENLRARAERVAQKTEGASGVRNEIIVTTPDANWFQHGAVALAPTLMPEATVANGMRTVPLETLNTQQTRETGGFRPSPPPYQGGVRGGLGERTGEARPAIADTRPGRRDDDGQPEVKSYWVRRSPEAAANAVPSRTAIAVAQNEPIAQGTGGQAARGTPNDSSHGIVLRGPIAMAAPAPIIVEDRANSLPASAAFIRPAARFVAPSTESVSTAYGPVIVAAPMESTPSAVSNAIPVSSDRDVRADIESVLRRDRRAAGLNYHLDKGELVLSGWVSSPADLQAVAAQLNHIAGVDLVAWEKIRFGQ